MDTGDHWPLSVFSLTGSPAPVSPGRNQHSGLTLLDTFVRHSSNIRRESDIVRSNIIGFMEKVWVWEGCNGVERDGEKERKRKNSVRIESYPKNRRQYERIPE